MMKKQIETLISNLQNLRENGPKKRWSGICGNITYGKDSENTYVTYEFISKIIARWPGIDPNGSPSYPIAGAGEPMEGKWIGERGKRRLELIDFLIQELEKLEGE